MKKIFLFLSLSFSIIYSHAQDKVNVPETKVANGPVMNFETTVLDYGLIEHNSDGNREMLH